MGPLRLARSRHEPGPDFDTKVVSRMHILVTNDDGVTAPGLLALANAMRPLGDVSVLAPDRNWSGGARQDDRAPADSAEPRT